MAVVNYQLRNIQNVQAMLQYMQGYPTKGPFEIGYIQAGGMVLLGRDHSTIDVDRVNQGDVEGRTFRGKLELRPTDDKKQKQLVVFIMPDGGKKGSMAELESAIKAAIDGTSLDTPFRGWSIKYAWQ